MGVYRRHDSPFWWVRLERPHQRPIEESTKIRVDASTSTLRHQNRQLAERIYHARMGDLARERHGLAPPAARPTILFQDYGDWYEKHVSKHKRGCLREKEILDHSLTPAFGALQLHEITKELVQEWMTARREAVSAATVNRELDLLKHMLRNALPKYLSVSPIHGLKRLRQTKYEARTLTPANERKLLLALSPVDRAIVIMALDTLMRLSDIVNLRREQDHGRYLTVLEPKQNETYKVPVSKRLRKALDALPKHSPYFFGSRRTQQTRNTVKQMLQHACARAGIDYGRAKGFTFHVLRHTGASRMVEAGADLRTVQEIGGWKNLRQLARYTHPTDQAKRRAVESVSARRKRHG